MKYIRPFWHSPIIAISDEYAKELEDSRRFYINLMKEDLDGIIEMTGATTGIQPKYIDVHPKIARRLKKPVRKKTKK